MRSLSFFQDVVPAQFLERLSALLDEASNPDWDGEGALSVSIPALVGAWKVLEQLQILIPSRVQPEDVTIVNTGNVMIDVYKNVEQQALLTVTADHQVAFAWRNNGDRIRGYTTVRDFQYRSELRSLLRRLS